MSDMVQIRSVKHYFNEFVVEGLKGKTNIQEIDLIGIKQKILTAFKNEIFGQIRFKYGDKAKDMSMDDIASLDGIHNILEQAFRKWRRLCMLCSEHGLGNFFQLEDLKTVLEDNTTIVADPEEVDVTDEIADNPVVITEENENGDFVGRHMSDNSDVKEKEPSDDIENSEDSGSV